MDINPGSADSVPDQFTVSPSQCSLFFTATEALTRRELWAFFLDGPCSDGNACTQTDTCQSGVCSGSNPVVCSQPSEPCRAASCTPASGECAIEILPNGTACDDGDACSQTDTCQSGNCTGSNPVPDATACNDGHGCTVAETCRSGNCLAPAAFAQPTGSPFLTGSNPVSVAAGDVNGDGRFDLAVAKRNSNQIAVLLGNGSGGFTQAVGSPFAVGTSPQSVAVGDVNGDGQLDLVTANNGSNNATVLLGNGSGGFTQAAGSPFAVGSFPSSVAVGDMNGDGRLDLAVANTGSSNVTVLLGNGSGGFTPAPGSPVPMGAGTLPRSVAVGYMNGDGHLDIAVASTGSDRVTILLGDGSGRFTQAWVAAVGFTPICVAVGDLNGDGKLDLAVANNGSNTVTILLGDGSGGFTQVAVFGVGNAPNSIAVGDLNGDGRLDLAVANNGSSSDTILLGNGSGGFTQAMGSPVGVGNAPSSVSVGDLNGDGKFDLATAFTGGGVTILLNTTARASSPAAEVDSGVRLRRSGGAAVLSWNLAACASSSDVLRGLVSALPVGPGGGDETCLANSLPPTTLTWTDGTNPATGTAFWYLVRGDSAGGHGPWGYQLVNGVPTIEEVSTTCP
jgi:hypothetical protein